MTWTDADLELLHRCPYRNEPAKWLALTTAERDLLEKLRPSHVITYWWPRTAAGARSRAAFCRRMARECEEEIHG